MHTTPRFTLFLFCAFWPAMGIASPSAAVIYEKNCAGCHGANGKGQTRLGRKSGAKDLTDRNGAGKLSDQQIFETIKLGRKDKNGEETMEPFGKQLSDREMTELVAYVRRFTR
jgi:mono/diheme cytochrome c family protein